MVVLVDDGLKETQPILRTFQQGRLESPQYDATTRFEQFAMKILKRIVSVDMTSEKNNLIIEFERIQETSLKTEDTKDALESLLVSVGKNDKLSAKNYAEVLSRKINKENALFCLRHMKLRPALSRSLSYEPTAPPPHSPPSDQTKENRNEDWVTDLEDNLRNICLLEIDKNAYFILKQKDLLELDYGDLLNLTTRDTLQISNELLIYGAIMRWGLERQRKSNEGRNNTNLRNLLGDLVYAPRYGLMTKTEFLTRTIEDVQGPDRSGILTESEIDNIINYIKKKSKNQLVDPLPFRASQPRKRRNSSENSSLNPVCEKHLLNFLTCWTAVFD